MTSFIIVFDNERNERKQVNESKKKEEEEKRKTK